MTGLKNNTFTRALWCSVTGHLILHFHLQTFVTRLALIFGILTMQNVENGTQSSSLFIGDLNHPQNIE